MLRVLIFLISINIIVSSTEVAILPKLPLYIGKGYDILKGNPLSSEGVDPGFAH